MTKTTLFNIVLIHTARTWERIRVEQPYKEMPYDNIDSTEIITEIAEQIIEDKVLQKFLNSKNWDWSEETEEGFSDSYIESIAERLIVKHL